MVVVVLVTATVATAACRCRGDDAESDAAHVEFDANVRTLVLHWLHAALELTEHAVKLMLPELTER